VQEDLERVCYGYKGILYISVILIGLGIIGIALGITLALLTYPIWVLVVFWALGVILLASGIFWHVTMGFTYDTQKMGSIKDGFLDEVKSIWDGRGKVLDVGTGRGWAAIEIARRFPESQVVGIDIWTKFFSLMGQTKEGAEKNAVMANVTDRCTFQYSNALNLPFNDGEFQLVVSSFTFHEVHAPDRTVLFKEIARVLAPGGTFLILDFFAGSFVKMYKVNSGSELLEKVQKLGIEGAKIKALKETGVDLGRFYRRFWEVDFFSGRKV